MAEKINILLIEDNPGDRQPIMQEFKNFGQKFTFNIKQDGEDALAFLDELADDLKPAEIPHLIILDLNLPRASGIEILKQYKSNPILRATPVVVFSSSSSQKDILSAYANNANCYVVKPFSYDDFSKAIHSIWDFWFNISKLPKAMVSV